MSIQSKLSASSSALMAPSSFKKLNRLSRPRVKRSDRRRNPVKGGTSQKKKVAPNSITENLVVHPLLPRQQPCPGQFGLLRTPPMMSQQNFPPEPLSQFHPLPPQPLYAPPPPQYSHQFQPHSYLPQFQTHSYLPQFQPHSYLPQFRPHSYLPQFRPHSNLPQFQPHPHSYPIPTAPPAPYDEPSHPAYNGPPTPYAPPQSRAFNGQGFYAPPPPLPHYQPQPPPQTFLPQVPRDFAPPTTPQHQCMFQPFSGGLDGPSQQTRPWDLPSDFLQRWKSQ